MCLLTYLGACCSCHSHNLNFTGDILEVARTAETAIGTTAAHGDMSAVMDEIKASRAELRQLANRVERMSVGSMSRRSPTPEPRRVTFAPDRRSPARKDAIRGQSRGRPFRRGVFRCLDNGYWQSRTSTTSQRDGAPKVKHR